MKRTRARGFVIQVRLSEEELMSVERYADQYDISLAEALRRMLREKTGTLREYAGPGIKRT